jgi:hypothetical protein
MWQRVLAGVSCVFIAATVLDGRGGFQSESPLTQEDGQRLEQKIEQISQPASDAQQRPPVVLYQREVNAYLRFQAAPEFPPGVTEPFVALGDGGGVTASATVDLSGLRDDRPRGLFDPLRYLGGDLPVSARGVLRTERGVGRVEVVAVTLGGLPVPATILSELVRYYSRNEQRPNGVDLAEPFELPYGVTEVRVEHEQAVVVR